MEEMNCANKQPLQIPTDFTLDTTRATFSTGKGQKNENKANVVMVNCYLV